MCCLLCCACKLTCTMFLKLLLRLLSTCPCSACSVVMRVCLMRHSCTAAPSSSPQHHPALTTQQQQGHRRHTSGREACSLGEYRCEWYAVGWIQSACGPSCGCIPYQAACLAVLTRLGAGGGAVCLQHLILTAGSCDKAILSQAPGFACTVST